MQVDILGSYRNVSEEYIGNRDVVVIDVYRTTSVIVTALARKALCVIPAESVDEAWKMYNRDSAGSMLLGGERKALPIKGFHLDNSPNAYTEERVRGKRLVLTTSNGTRAIKVCSGGKRVYIASFLNASAVAEALLSRANDVAVVCSGTFGRFALEDGLCAGMIASCLSKKADTEISDLGIAMVELFSAKTDIRKLLSRGSVAYRYLERAGYGDDIEYCLQRDRYEITPCYSKGSVTA
jgi:2-phosphosulfolactate phosphatase